MLTETLLSSYQNAALENAKELLEEARQLYLDGHNARAYFLATSSIEEAGKAYLAFSAKSRNLKDGGVCKKIKEKFENHFTKIIAAFIAWITNSTPSEETFKRVNDFVFGLISSREKSMYVDINDDSTLSIPSRITESEVASNCIFLATNCIRYTTTYVNNSSQQKTSSFDDKFFCLNQSKIDKILNSTSFLQYFISQLKKGDGDFKKAIITWKESVVKKFKLGV